MSALESTDPQVAEAIRAEEQRQRRKLELIASENYASSAVLEAQGSVLNDKYAEGYPGRRYYGGCENVDIVEQLAIDRVKLLYGAAHANVQPHSGAQANMAAYMSLLKVGDTVLSMSLKHGGHLTHGSEINFSGRLYRFASYGVDRETGQLDYDEVATLARKYSPKLIVAGYTAYPRTIDFARFRAIADEVGAYLMVDMAHLAGLVAAHLHPTPVPHAQVVTSTTHKTLRGPRGGFILCERRMATRVDRAVFPGVQGGPLMHVIAGKAVAFREALQPGFVGYMRSVLANASAMADELKAHGMQLVSGGTDTHLVVVDLRPLAITGQDAERLLDDQCITVNKNAIPFDEQPANVTSGIRLGTLAVTTRGMGEKEMRVIARLIVRVLQARTDEAALREVRREVEALCDAFPTIWGRIA